jgi:hypothetical protein
MAINVTTINGTDSVASSRITINDNFETVKSALNDLLSIIDIATGKINNFGYGSNNDIETEDLIVRGSIGGGINVVSGGIQVGNGNIVIGGTAGTGYLQIGGGTNSIRFEKVLRGFSSGPGNIATINLSGTGATAGAGPVGYVTLPRLNTAVINDIANPLVGSVVFDVDTTEVKVCTVSGPTGTWVAL